MNSLNSMIRLPLAGASVAVGLLSQAAGSGLAREYRSIDGLPERLWVHLIPGETPSFFAVRDKHVEGFAAAIQGFNLMQLRVSGVCVEVVAAYPGAVKDDQADNLLSIPASHVFALAKEGVVCSQMPCPSDVPASAWLCFALPRVMA